MLWVLQLSPPVGRSKILADILELPRGDACVGRRQNELRMRRGDVDEAAGLIVSFLLLLLRLWKG